MKSIIKKIYRILLFLTIITTVVVIVKIFFLASFKISTSSMEPTLLPGDHILVNKMIPGPRFFKNFCPEQKIQRTDLIRLKGIRNIKRNDVLVFNYPYSDWNILGFDGNTFYVKRCVGIPGDTFYIENGIYKVEGQKQILGNIEGQKQICQLQDIHNSEIYPSFPFKEEFDWNIRNFGPIYIPKKGDIISLDKVNFELYKNLVRYETGKELVRNENLFYLNDSVIVEYSFLTNYYFMVGDLIQDSKDSRYWGLLPEEHIIGKAEFVCQSKDINTGKNVWKRFLKKIY